jgi:tetratricopeptide (TPR) repeat protein
VEFIKGGTTMDAKEWFDSGQQAMMKGMIEEAIEAFDQSTSLDPSTFDAWWALANACNLLGSQIEGEGDFSRANLYKIKAAYSFDRATRVNPSDARVEKAKAFAETIREVQKKKKEQGLF